MYVSVCERVCARALLLQVGPGLGGPPAGGGGLLLGLRPRFLLPAWQGEAELAGLSEREVLSTTTKLSLLGSQNCLLATCQVWSACSIIDSPNHLIHRGPKTRISPSHTHVWIHAAKSNVIAQKHHPSSWRSDRHRPTACQKDEQGRTPFRFSQVLS